MNKVLRKHGKIILAVTGTLLMIAWVLMPSSSGRGGRDAAIERGKINGKKVTSQDLIPAANAIQVLRQLGGKIDPYRSNTAMSINIFFRNLDQRDPTLHLYLLLAEAKRYGIAATRDEVAAQIRDLNMTDADIRKFLEDLRTRPSALQAALADMLVVQKLANFSWSGLLPSEPEVLAAAEKSMARVKVDYIAFDASKPADKIGEPTAEQIQQQFDKYKSNLAGQAADKLPFGYKYPDRVKLEYLVVDRKAVRASVSPTRDDAIAAAEFYRANPDRFTKEPASQPADQKKDLLATSQPSTQPVVQPFEEVRGQLIEAQVSRRVDDLVRRIAREITTISSETTRRTEGAATQPSSWSRYEKIADEIQKRYNVRVTYFAPGPWLGADDLAKYPGIGESYLIVQNQPVATFANAMLNVKELDPATAPQVLRNTHVGNDYPPLMDQSGNMYIARVIAADKTHIPASLEDVKATVVSDLKKFMTYERYQKDAQQLAAAAKAKGLAEAAGKQKPTETPFFTREMPIMRQSIYGPQESGQYELTNLPGIGQVSEFMDAAFALLDSTAQHKVATASSPEKLAVYTIELKDSQPVAPSALRDLGTRARLARDARSQMVQTFSPKWSNLKAAAERVNFVPDKPFKDTDSAED